MEVSKKVVAIGILVIGIIITMSFTNIDNLISIGSKNTVSELVTGTDDIVSQVELENPFGKYPIQTRCDLFFLYSTSGDRSPHGFITEKNMAKYYPEKWQEIQKRIIIMQEQQILNRDVSMEFWGLYGSIILEEYMINPKLKTDISTIVYNGGGLWDLKDRITNEDPTCLKKYDKMNKTINLLRIEYKGHRDLDGNFVDSIEVQEYMKSIIPKYTQLHNVSNSLD